MTLSTDLLAASPTYASARSKGVRLVPLAQSPDINAAAWRELGVMLVKFASLAFALGIVCRLFWEVLT